MDGPKGVAAGRHAEGAPGVQMVGERHTVATHRHGSPDLKGTPPCLRRLLLCFCSTTKGRMLTRQPLKSCPVHCVTEEMGKPGSDAGMPGIEDSEVGKIDDAQFGKHQTHNIKKAQQPSGIK